MDPDAGLAAFKNICKDFGTFAQTRGRISEEDTRANLIDRILHEVLGWPRDAVHREAHSKAGFLDFKLLRGTPVAVVEAKAAGETFVIPYRKHSKAQRMKIGGALASNKTLLAALEQTHDYCAEEGIRFGITTNGYSWVIFKALYEGSSWRNGTALVFTGFKIIESDFTDFWNTLSYEAVQDGKLAETFHAGSAIDAREYRRPVEQIVDADATYARNPINIAMRPYVEKFFGDIAAQDTIEVLKDCYVYSRPVQIIDNELKLIINDNAPKFAAEATELIPTPKDEGGKIEKHLRQLVATIDYQGSVVLLMGGIGSGKTTFLVRFFKVVAPDLAKPDGNTFRIHIDFLGCPDRIEELDEFLWKKAATAVRETEPALNNRETLEKVFEKQLALIRQVYGEGTQQCVTKLNDEIFRLASDNREFTGLAIDFCRANGRLPLVVFDNVDQLGIQLQAHVFTTTEHLANHFGCLALLVIREETFSAAQMQKQLTAYTIKAYHLSSPSFGELIRLRIDYATNAAAKRRQQGALKGLREPEDVSADEILEFFNLLRKSVFHENHTIIRLLAAISFGNMRFALQLFSNFLVSGAINLPKMLAIFQNEGRYFVPFHEFAKSVILGDYRFYKETRSFIYSLFHITAARNSSHFTALRILHYLANRPVSTQGGEGFADLHELVAAFVDLFDNEDDCIKTILRMSAINRQLVELDTRRPDTIIGAATIRISSAGRYYLEHLVSSFAYLDLVWHDTPFTDRKTCDEIVKLMHSTDLMERLKRVDAFLDYLEEHERREVVDTGITKVGSVLSVLFLPRIRNGILASTKPIEEYVRKFAAKHGLGQRLDLDGFVVSKSPSKSKKSVSKRAKTSALRQKRK